MVPLELLTVPLDFLLILLVNGTPTAECTPMIIAQDTATEQRESFVQCQVVSDSIDGIDNGAEFLTKTTDLIESMEAAFATENDHSITIRLAPTQASLSPAATPESNE